MNLHAPLKLAQTSLGPIRPVGNNVINQGSNSNTQVLKNLELFISQILGILTVVASLFFVVNMMLAAVNWITAGGDASKISKARDSMVQNTIGLIIVVGSYAIIGLIGSIVGLQLLRPAQVLQTIIP
jgi:hypothetical protein